MNIQAEKLELVRMILDTDTESEFKNLRLQNVTSSWGGQR